jgi:hypothetical protein
MPFALFFRRTVEPWLVDYVISDVDGEPFLAMLIEELH